MSLKAVAALTIGLLALTGLVGLIAVASGPHPRIIISGLAQMVKQAQITAIEVSTDGAVATTRQQETLGLHIEPSANLSRQVRSFGVSADELSQIDYTVASPSQFGLIATALGTLLPVLLLGGLAFIALRSGSKQHGSQFEASMASALGGHAAETLVFGEMSTGASNDLERATALARRMVTEYGMSARLGAVTLVSAERAGYGGETRTHSEHTAQLIDREVRRLDDEAYARARQVIVEQGVVLDRMAHALLKCETLQGAELERVFSVDVAWPLGAQPGMRLPSGRQLVPFPSAGPAAAAAMSLEIRRRN